MEYEESLERALADLEMLQAAFPEEVKTTPSSFFSLGEIPLSS